MSFLRKNEHGGDVVRKLALTAVACAFAGLASGAETIAYWPFGTNGFHDVSGNGHDLTSSTVTEGDAAYVTLDGTSQFLQTASALDLSQETQVTFECWTRMTGANKDFGILFSSASPHTVAGGVVMYWNKASSRLQSQYRVVVSDATPWQTDATNLFYNSGAWHHVAYTIDRTQNGNSATILFVDGIAAWKGEGKTGTMPQLFNDVFYIGGGSAYAAGNNFFTGCIDDVRISRGILTPDQFLKYPTAGKAMRADDGRLPVLAYWPFGNKVGTDVTGNGFDLTMTSVPMTSGTPTPAWSNFVNTCKTSVPIPFSAFSKVGLTIECYAKSGSGSDSSGYLFESTTDYSANLGAFCLRYEPYFKAVSAYFRTATGKLAGAKTTVDAFGALNDQHWRHFAFVYDPSKTGPEIAKLYIDGVAAPTDFTEASQGSFALADAALHLMRRSVGSSKSYNFYGSFDDARITAGALTPDQFLPARSDLSDKLVALYRFDRGTLEDQTGNGNDFEHLQNGTVVNSPTFADGGYPESGTGVVLSGNGGTKDWLKTASALDLSGTKAVTIEIDYNAETPGTGANYFLAGSETPASSNGIVTYLDKDRKIHAQARKEDGSGWRAMTAYPVPVGTPTNGYQRVRYVVNGNNTGTSYYTVNVDGASTSVNDTQAISGLPNQEFCLGHSPSYVQDYWMKGKILRVAVTAAALGAADYVLDGILPDEVKRPLAYWDFHGFNNKQGGGLDLVATSGCTRRRGALALDGDSSASTVGKLDLSGLAQATVECFVLFGATPSSGTLFAMGSGEGSFVVSADAAAGTLSGAFVPYADHPSSHCGGATALAPLAGKDAWHHVALVIDRTRPGADAVRLYVDYQRATPAGRAWDVSAAMLDDYLFIGSDPSLENGFTGRIDDVRVSAGALAPAEFLQLAERTETQDGLMIFLR